MTAPVTAPPTATTRWHAQQVRVMDGYHFEVRNEAGLPVADIQWPALAQARNARLRWHGSDDRAGRPRLTINGQAWTIAFEYLDRGWMNDVRYELMSPDERSHASAEFRFAPGKLRPGALSLSTPVAARFVRVGWLRKRYELQGPAGRIGEIAEPRLITLRRQLVAELPATLSVPQQMFIVYLGCQLVQGH